MSQDTQVGRNERVGKRGHPPLAVRTAHEPRRLGCY